MHTTQTERNRALALVRYGAVLRTQSRLEEGSKAIGEAVQILGTMREQGDLSETTAIGLALGLSTQARLASSSNLEGKALAISARAIEAIKPLATVPNPSVAARRAYAMKFYARLPAGTQQNELAIATLEEARKSLASIDLRLTDLSPPQPTPKPRRGRCRHWSAWGAARKRNARARKASPLRRRCSRSVPDTCRRCARKD